MAIISASRRTDIPAFFPDWFLNRIKAGYFFKVNPFNPNQVTGVSLAVEDVDCIVFWSKYPRPLLETGGLNYLDNKGYNYYFLYTINAYGDYFELPLPELKKRIKCFKELAYHLGSHRVIWRYDPIIISNYTDVDFHCRQFARLAKELSSYTERVIISFLDLYAKTRRKLKQVEKENLKVKDPLKDKERLLFLCHRLKEIAEGNNLDIQSCGELDNPSREIISPGSCIDGELIEEVFDLKLASKRDTNQRETCLCIEAEDMGQYDTCRFACRYCYANQSKQAVEENLKEHNPAGKVLIGSCDREFEEQMRIDF